MNYLSMCSGIEGATVAWHPLGWRAVAYSEIEPFCSALLEHYYPDTPNFGDAENFHAWPKRSNVDVLVGGTPCQSFSVAGLRRGLDDPRGNLALTYLAIAERYRPRWVVWENVPGVLSSDEGRAMGSFLGGLAKLGYGFAYRVLDAQFFGLAQRRRRVFVVGHSGGQWQLAAAVLFDRASLRGDSPPSRAQGEGLAPSLAARTRGGGGLGTDAECDGGLIAHSLRADGFDASEDGTGRGTPLVPDVAWALQERDHKGADSDTKPGHLIPFDTTQITHPDNGSNPQPGDPSPSLSRGGHAPSIAFDARQSDVLQYGEQSGPLDTAGNSQAVAFHQSQSGVREYPNGPHPTLDANKGSRRIEGVRDGMSVRRLTPRECERLQGFPDDYTLIPYRNGWSKDGPRYRALGNSFAIPVVRWIGRRIELVDQITEAQCRAANASR